MPTPRADPESETAAVSGQAAADAAEANLPRGSLVDRYVVLDPIGKGGMGLVYSAYDPQLDRKVALKFLRSPARAEGTEEVRQADEWRARLMREAQAMARLSH